MDKVNFKRRKEKSQIKTIRKSLYDDNRVGIGLKLVGFLKNDLAHPV